MSELDDNVIDSNDASGATDDPRLWQIVSEFEAELKAGRRPRIDDYVKRHPEFAPSLAESLEGLQLIHTALSDTSSASGGKARRHLAASLPERSSAPLGDFQITGEIARGGMGIVYEAIQLSLGRKVALKVLPFAATIDGRHLQRFKLEAQAAALLHHTNIVPIYAVGCERGVHFYAMQLIEGQSLAAVINVLMRQRKNLSTDIRSTSESSTCADTGEWKSHSSSLSDDPKACSTIDVSQVVTAGNSVSTEVFIRRATHLMIQAADGLEHAHQAGIVHRDIKPANLLIDRAGNLWITDFGLAQLQNANGVTRSTDVVGTFRYMSPEQTSGQRAVLDHRTDIYSLSATFYEMLTLEPVIASSSHQELLYQVLHAEPRRPRDLNRAIPVELETILLKGLSKSPTERYASAADLAADLRRFLDHQPIHARRPSPIDRIRKWGRRNPTLVGAAFALLMVILVGSLAANWMISHEQQKTASALAGQRVRAEEAEARFKQTRQAVDTMLQISEEELADRPTEAARRRILEVVLTHYEDFIEQRSGDQSLQAELAQVQSRVKAILHELNVLQGLMENRLLESAGVQQELKLSDQQRSALKMFLDEARKQTLDLSGTLHTQSDSTRRARMVAIAEHQQGELEQILSAQQLSRFRQIALQSLGLLAFKYPQVVRDLGLSSEQRSKIRNLEREMFAEAFRPGDLRPPGVRPDPLLPPPKGAPGFPGDFERDRFRLPSQPHTLMATWVERACQLLTAEQVEKWRKLTGQPFAEIVNRPFPPLPL